ncbi:MAG: DUF2791 family P-loop domain-containing protein [Ardenticatenales bacterium]|nr:DUF2791 family P-loop domain-containing protein [Ardenticatenales bacterium]
MIGEVVEHPQYGRGQVVAAYRNGSEWMVRFESGLRFRRPRQEFVGEGDIAPTKSVVPPLLNLPPPMTQTQFEARQLIEALRFGVAPAQHAREFTIGLEAERASVSTALNEAHQEGGGVRAVLGEYGFGKSHIVELTAQEALARNFLVATVSLDLLELPPHRPFDIYSALMRNVRYPDSDERGLGPLLERASSGRNLLAPLRDLAPTGLDPLMMALEAFGATSSVRQRAAWQQWLMGGRRVTLMNKATPRGIKFPSIYRVGHNARQITYLLTAISTLARLANYSGLCILIDEAESYSLLGVQQRPKANLFFKAMILAALRHRQSRITPDELPQHRYREYPAFYDAGQSLFFLFTITHSENQLPLNAWLDPEHVILLNPHHTPQEIGQFLQQLQGYHAHAYGYEPGERQGQVRRAASELLAQGLRNDRLSLRGLVRLSVELYDLLYLYPGYESALLLDELRAQMR